MDTIMTNTENMNTENTIEYKISAHCKTRYAERLLGKDNTNDINRFIAENEEKIKTDLNKMIYYGEMIFAGKQSQKDGKGKVLNVYIKDTWCLLVDTKSEVVVTIYKIDLGCGDEFNKDYISKMLDKLNKNKELLETAQIEVQLESNMYKELIDESAAQIRQYKTMIKNLEELCVGYQTIIDNNCVKISQANREVAEVVNTLINKREF